MSGISKLQGLLAIVFFSVFCIYFIPAPEHGIRIHDCFDGNFSSRHVLIHSGHLFDVNPTTTVPGIMNGLPRGVFSRYTELAVLLMYVFGSLPGFSILFLIVRLIAFFGVYLFGRDHLNVKADQKGLLLMVSAAFAALPFFIIHGTTVAGIPFLLWAFYNLLKDQRKAWSFLVFILFALWSNLVLVGFHILLVLGLLAVGYSVSRKKIQWTLFIALIVTGLTYVLSDYMLLYLHGLDANYKSSRGEFEKVLGLNLKGVIGCTFKTFFTGDYSTANYFGYLFLPFFVCYIYFLFKKPVDDNRKMGWIFLAIVLFSSFFINLLDWKGFAFFYETFSFAKTFNFKRFTSLIPAFFFILLLIVLLRSTDSSKKILHFVVTFAVLALFVFLWRGNISYNNSGFNNTGLKIQRDEVTTFNAFFEQPLYAEVKKEMGKDTLNNIIHFGLSPSPSKYAGLNVLDDYQGDYPQTYKAQFRKIIERELDRSPEFKDYFDNWGSRCYIYSAGLFENKLQNRFNLPYEPELLINTQQIKAMNCNYLFSGILIGNTKELGLRLKKVLVGPYDHKTYFLYQII